MLTTPVKLNLKEIAVATDFSHASNRALDYAVSIARHYDSELVLAHGISNSELALGPQELAATLDVVREHADKQLASLRTFVTAQDIPVRQQLGVCSPSDFVAQLCAEQSVDMVVVGTHGARGLRRFVLGSVAEEIIRSVHCPVLTVGPHVKRRPQLEAQFGRILFASDFSVAAEKAASYALSLAQEYQAELTLLHVITGERNGSPDGDRVGHFFTNELRAYVPAEALEWCDVDFQIEYGEAAKTIVEVATGKEADLVVLGARQHSQTDGLFRSSTAYQVICNAECPVLTVRA